MSQKKNSRHNAKAAEQTLRIIGGSHRSRRLSFRLQPGLRPTGDRIRETLFNWLQADINGARCLDVFAGSGALGFEALSRGASEVVMVEQNALVAREIQDNLENLAFEGGAVVCRDALHYLSEINVSEVSNNSDIYDESGTSSRKFDIVFLDPPFASELLPQSMALLAQSSCLAASALIYIECARASTLQVPENWCCLKQKHSGDVTYALYQVESVSFIA